MDRFNQIVGMLLLGTLIAGCSSKDATPPVADSTKPGVGAAEGPGPDKVAHQFMMTIKTGDEAQAAMLLTDKARSEVQRTGMDVMASGSQSMEFSINGVEYVTEAKDGAHVAATISDVDADQNRVSNHVLWFLRKEPAGWRVAGIAIKIFDGEPPVLYNFEEPEETARKQQLVIDEVERRAQAAAQQAAGVQNTTQQAATPNTTTQQSTTSSNEIQQTGVQPRTEFESNQLRRQQQSTNQLRPLDQAAPHARRDGTIQK